MHYDNAAFVGFFRLASPYINAHRGKTFVVYFGGEAVDDANFSSLIHDVALLNSLGIKLVLVHGARPQIERRLRQAGVASQLVGAKRVTDEDTLPLIKEAVGRARIRIESLLSTGLANSPMHGARIRTVSGNVVTARPIGVRDGVDFGFSGEVRRVDQRAVRGWLDSGAIVLLSPLGYSPTGEAFNMLAEDVAVAVASALHADKLLLLYEGADLTDAEGKLVRQLSASDAARLLTAETADADTHPASQLLQALNAPLPNDVRKHLEQAVSACRQGVRRVHLLRRELDGGLLLELFTRDGVGTLVASDVYEGLRPATIDDVGGILELIRPLEQAGTLVRRSRELLEIEIDRFIVLERDGTIIGCAALYPYPEPGADPVASAAPGFAELACLAVDPDYRNQGRAEALLQFVEHQARKQRLRYLFVLTTQTAHWFRERGFEPAELSELPVTRQQLYNIQRRSKVFIKPL